MGDVGRKAKQMLNGPTISCHFYEGTYTDQSPITMTGANRIIDRDLEQASAWVKTGHVVKDYTTTEGWYQAVAAADDASLIRGIVEGRVTRNATADDAWGKIRKLVPNDILKMQCDATHTAIAFGDPITIDAIDTATGASHKYGITVDVAGPGEEGFGYALNALALDTAGYIAVEWVKPDYFYLPIGVNGNIAAEVYPLGFADHAGKIVGVRHNATSQTTAGAFNITNAGSDIKSTADWATVTTAAWVQPDQNATIAAGAEVLLDVSSAGGSSDVLDFRGLIKILKERVM